MNIMDTFDNAMVGRFKPNMFLCDNVMLISTKHNILWNYAVFYHINIELNVIV